MSKTSSIMKKQSLFNQFFNAMKKSKGKLESSVQDIKVKYEEIKHKYEEPTAINEK